jgi:hypothetical protein
VKTYPVSVGGKSFVLDGMTDKVKESILDIVKAREFKSALRLGRSKLIGPDEFEAMKDAVLAMTFVSSPVMRFFTDPDGLKTVYKIMAKDVDGKAISDDDAAAMVEASKDETSDLFVVAKLMFEDALPKA